MVYNILLFHFLLGLVRWVSRIARHKLESKVQIVLRDKVLIGLMVSIFLVPIHIGCLRWILGIVFTGTQWATLWTCSFILSMTLFSRRRKAGPLFFRKNYTVLEGVVNTISGGVPWFFLHRYMISQFNKKNIQVLSDDFYVACEKCGSSDWIFSILETEITPIFSDATQTQKLKCKNCQHVQLMVFNETWLGRDTVMKGRSHTIKARF